MPLDRMPLDENYCPVCQNFTLRWERAHVVGRGQGGDDVPENLVWLCPKCHDAFHSLPPDFLVGGLRAECLVRYCRETIPELGAYADAKKFRGYIEFRYLGWEKDLEPVA